MSAFHVISVSRYTVSIQDGPGVLGTSLCEQKLAKFRPGERYECLHDTVNMPESLAVSPI